MSSISSCWPDDHTPESQISQNEQMRQDYVNGDNPHLYANHAMLDNL